MPHRAPGSTGNQRSHLGGRPIRYYRPRGSAEVRTLIDEGFQAFNAARLGESCRIFSDKMLSPGHDTTIALTVSATLRPLTTSAAERRSSMRLLVQEPMKTRSSLTS